MKSTGHRAGRLQIRVCGQSDLTIGIFFWGRGVHVLEPCLSHPPSPTIMKGAQKMGWA